MRALRRCVARSLRHSASPAAYGCSRRNRASSALRPSACGACRRAAVRRDRNTVADDAAAPSRACPATVRRSTSYLRAPLRRRIIGERRICVSSGPFDRNPERARAARANSWARPSLAGCPRRRRRCLRTATACRRPSACRLSVLLPAPLPPISRSPDPRTPMHAACSGTSDCARDARVTIASSMSSYRAWYGRRSMAGDMQTRARASATSITAKLPASIVAHSRPLPAVRVGRGGSRCAPTSLDVR